MLKAPFTNLPYEPKIDSLFAGLDAEYKSEAFKRELLKLNPNNAIDRKKIIKDYIIKDKEYLTYKHKFLLTQELIKALNNATYDFTAPFEYDYDTDEPSSSPWSADQIDDPRAFFEAILEIALEAWRSDLEKASEEDPSKW